MSDRDVLGLRVHLSQLAERLSQPRSQRDTVELARLLRQARDELDAALTMIGSR